MNAFPFCDFVVLPSVTGWLMTSAALRFQTGPGSL
jgi:hypothetical protein